MQADNQSWPATYNRARYAAHPSDTVLTPGTDARGNGIGIMVTCREAARRIGEAFDLPGKRVAASDARREARAVTVQIQSPAALLAYAGCQAAAESYPLPRELQSERGRVAVDAWLRMARAVAADAHGWIDADAIRRAVDAAAHVVRREAGMDPLHRNVEGDGIAGPDAVGRNYAADTHRQVMAKLCLDALHALARADANVGTYLATLTGRESIVPCEAMDAAPCHREGEADVTRWRRAAMMHRNGQRIDGASKTVRGRVERSKASKRERAAHAVAVVAAAHGFHAPTESDAAFTVTRQRPNRIPTYPMTIGTVDRMPAIQVRAGEGSYLPAWMQ